MKAIKDCEWEVELCNAILDNKNKHWWSISISVGKETAEITSNGSWISKYLAKRNWERFAKVNKIKKWKYEQKPRQENIT